MKAIYWKPGTASVHVYVLIAGISLIGLFLIENFKIDRKQPYYSQKMEAAKTADSAFALIRSIRLDQGKITDIEYDPARSGLIGSFLTPVTSNTGIITAKQTSVNPNFAALIVEMLRKAGVEEEGVVAIGLSGSFPALNICVYSAAKSLKLKVLSISSISSSQWGANDPDFLWIDMERELQKEKVFPYRSIAVSYGGVEDRALGISREGRLLLDGSVKRNHLPLIASESFTESIEERMRRFKEGAGNQRIQAYINVGGGSISVGTRAGKISFKPGLNVSLPPGAAKIDSVMTRFLLEDIPVIHLTEIEELAKKNGFPLQPKVIPKPGEGEIFSKEEYNRWFVFFVLAGILTLIFFLFRSRNVQSSEDWSGIPL
ncbi:poly-gamma-glutamate system protein [Leptospira perolatii]|uniref:Poly-gamma-glutamate system protein n=1 Tax=Leptospira perolatii TaxID=2023191 RepID=A0A2M9ZQM6_9LEPT|nr:poly-gamma-glutamate system protein [Leptospira perolatii]PJZ70536.1 poly-gamma-glutamate system protein [Leptospira perolatii]PJZ74372.1 poly-gamma-glutamate system protein [Leptospira perolatii]